MRLTDTGMCVITNYRKIESSMYFINTVKSYVIDFSRAEKSKSYANDLLRTGKRERKKFEMKSH